METPAFWIEEGNDLFRPTIHTQGPWDPRFQHGGPPGALLVRQMEKFAPREDTVMARVALDIFGPVPVAPLRAHARLVRQGRSVEKLEALLEHEGKLVMRATGWRIKLPPERPVAVETKIELPFPPPEEAIEGNPIINQEWSCGFLRATEWRFIQGNFTTHGPAIVWQRMRYPLLDDEETSPAQLLVLCADSTNGVSSLLDIREWHFINPEITVHCLRPPTGEWICLDANTTVQTEGIGLATSKLYDVRGLVGQAAQSLYISHRG
jgi:hypothetical protein